MKLTHYGEKHAIKYRATLRIEVEFTSEEKLTMPETFAEKLVKEQLDGYGWSEFIKVETDDTTLVVKTGEEEIES